MKRFCVVVATLLSVADIGRVAGRGIEVVYQEDEACECDKELSFCVDRPKDAAGVQLGSYGYDVIRPPAAPVGEVHYNFDYTIQTPVESVGQQQLQGLQAEVDRVLVHREDCVQKQTPDCNCHQYRPHIDTVPACNSRRRQRRSISVEDYAMAKPGANQFYDRTRPLEQLLQEDLDSEAEQLFSANPAKPNQAGHHLRLKIRQFFETLKQQQQQLPQQQQHPAPAPHPAQSPDNRAAALRAKWADMLAARNAIPKERLLLRRRRDIMPEYWHEQMVQRSHPQFVAAEDLQRQRKQCPTCRQEDASSIFGGAGEAAAVEGGDQMQAEASAPPATYVEYGQTGEPIAYQLGSGRNSQSDQVQYRQQQQQQQPRFVFDRLGHRYLERDGRLLLVAEPAPQSQSQPAPPPPSPVVGDPRAATDPQTYAILEEIIRRNRPIIQASNIEGGHLIAEPIQLTRDTFGFLHDLGDRSTSKAQNNDYRIEERQLRGAESKRNYKLVPLLQDKRDGSVLVRIAPRKSPRAKATKSATSKLNSVEEGQHQEPHSNSLDSQHTPEFQMQASAELLDYGSEGYEIVSLVEDGSAQRLDPKDKDFEVLRLMYDTETGKYRQQMEGESREHISVESNGGPSMVSEISAAEMAEQQRPSVQRLPSFYAMPAPMSVRARVNESQVQPARRIAEERAPIADAVPVPEFET